MGRLAALWGVGGVVALLSMAIYGLAGISLDSFRFDYDWRHWLALIVNVIFMCYSEGYRGFQHAFSPRTAARARYLRDNPTLIRGILAPLFCMGYFQTTKRRLISVYLLTLGIVLLVAIFHQISQPWRGILDAGVVCGLLWGVTSLMWFALGALGKGEFCHSPELP